MPYVPATSGTVDGTAGWFERAPVWFSWSTTRGVIQTLQRSRNGSRPWLRHPPASPASHEGRAPFKCSHIPGGQIEPLASLSLGGESLVPIGLDSDGIIGADRVYRQATLRELESDRARPPFEIECTPNLVELA